MEYEIVTQKVSLTIELILENENNSNVRNFFFVLSGLKIISHGNPNNNLESPCRVHRVYTYNDNVNIYITTS
jgi:hypothetical protein